MRSTSTLRKSKLCIQLILLYANYFINQKMHCCSEFIDAIEVHKSGGGELPQNKIAFLRFRGHIEYKFIMGPMEILSEAIFTMI